MGNYAHIHNCGNVDSKLFTFLRLNPIFLYTIRHIGFSKLKTFELEGKLASDGL